MERTIREIDIGRKVERETLERFLASRGIKRDEGTDYTAGVFDEEERLIAAGSLMGNTLRSLAVSEEAEGEGLMNTLVTHLCDRLYQNGVTHFFLYTKPIYARLFSSLGFYEIARSEPFAVFMENRRDGFQTYINAIARQMNGKNEAAAVVMNANPMTNGHLALVKSAALSYADTAVFVVSEDRSFFSAEARFEIVKETLSKFKNVYVFRTNSYMISSATFPAYFIKQREEVTRAHALLDAQVFLKIAAALNIKARYVGTEPFSRTTELYNQTLRSILPSGGVALHLSERVSDERGVPISASRVRALIKDGSLESVKPLVPRAAYEYLLSKEGQAVINRMKAAENVAHD